MARFGKPAAATPAAAADPAAAGATSAAMVPLDDPFCPTAATPPSRPTRKSGLKLFVERLDWGLVIPFLACAGLLAAYVLGDAEPFQRAVYAADRTIAMPVVPKKKQMPGFEAPLVPGLVLLAAAAAAEFGPLLLVGMRRGRGGGGGGGGAAGAGGAALSAAEQVALVGGRPPRASLAAAALVRAVGGMIVALCATMCMTEFLKIFCGRPRPDYLSRCVPKVPAAADGLTAGEVLDGLVLSAGRGPVAPVECTSTDKAAIVESRKSFPSGHTSSASSAGLWGAMYVLYTLRRFRAHGPAVEDVYADGGDDDKARGRGRRALLVPRLARELIGSAALLLMLFFLAWPWGVGATRFVDNRHHPSDIIGGLLLGVLMTVPFFFRFAAVSDAWDSRDSRDAPALMAVGGGGAARSNGAAAASGAASSSVVAPSVATQV